MNQELLLAVLAFAFCLVAIGFSGVRVAVIADVLADRTGWGEALMGAVFVGATTSLSGSVLSVVSAWQGHPEIAVSNAVGGIGAQMAFLAIADMFYRKANLEHAAASQENLVQGVLLILLLTLVLMAINGPVMQVLHVHPVSLVMVVVWIVGVRLISISHERPMWAPRMTLLTRADEPAAPATADDGTSMSALWWRFGVHVLIVGSAGWVLSQAGITMAAQTGLSETLVGGLFTAVTTSVPELVVAVAAVRQGALTLAVGDIVGGNVFDTLIIAVADFAYRDGSIYHVLSGDHQFMLNLVVLMTGILLAGLLQRERHGIGNIGAESALILLCYLGGFLILFLT